MFRHLAIPGPHQLKRFLALTLRRAVRCGFTREPQIRTNQRQKCAGREADRIKLSFDEAAAVKRAGMYYEQLPISGAADLKQLKVLAFDNILRQYHGKKVALHCGSGNRVGAVTALRAGWLRGRKMDTAMARGRSHGLSKLEDEVYNRLLVPR